jgi:hypothetical protein
LTLSRRTVRFNLEKVLKTLAVRDLSEAAAMQGQRPGHVGRPADECPYPKPFPRHFARCPGYLARRVIDLDQQQLPVGTIWTCRHLEARRTAARDHRWYGACVLGDGGSRAKWAEEAGPNRVRMINYLVHEMANISEPFTLRLWELKLDQAGALEKQNDTQSSTRSMQWLANRFITAVDKFLTDRRVLLEHYHLSLGTCRDLAGQLLDEVLGQRPPASWDHRFDGLLRFPEDCLHPGSQQTAGSNRERAASKRATSDS